MGTLGDRRSLLKKVNSFVGDSGGKNETLPKVTHEQINQLQ